MFLIDKQNPVPSERNDVILNHWVSFSIENIRQFIYDHCIYFDLQFHYDTFEPFIFFANYALKTVLKALLTS